MCGICGFYTKKDIRIEQLKRMNDTMVHRGPDDSGEELFDAKDGYRVGLAQRRLSILDLSPLGHQPMHAADERVILVFNGEIYNFEELKKQLPDYPFRSRCDTEVLLAAYETWGLSFVDKCNGMFAIALYDRQDGSLYLIRDRIGKKPLYYWEDGENLVFGSELKAIMACPGFPRAIRKDVLPRYLFQQYIPEPDTVFENVFQVLPGEILRFCRGETKKRSYWDIADRYRKGIADPVTDYGEGKARLKELLTAAVKRRMIADVDLGTFLSGGYDSSLVTAIAAGLSDTPVKTFSIGFEEQAYDESGYAAKIASYLGTEHTQRIITEKEMFDLVESIPDYYDQPFADSSQIPTMLVSALAKEKVTVALSGDGGDEFFCGYGMYGRLHQAQRLDGLGGLVHGICGLPGLRQAKVLEKLPFKVRAIAGNRDGRFKTQLCSPHYLDCVRGMAGDGEVRFLKETEYGVKDWQVRRMLLDMDTYLPGYILCKVDRASMKYSLEARCPVLDRDVMEYSFRLPQSFKYGNGMKKRILKEIAWDYLPKELLERPKKGFSVPMDKWLAGPLKERLSAYAEEGFLRRQGLFCPEYTQALVEGWLRRGDGGAGSGANDSKILWAFFIFEQWYERWIER